MKSYVSYDTIVVLNVIWVNQSAFDNYFARFSDFKLGNEVSVQTDCYMGVFCFFVAVARKLQSVDISLNYYWFWAFLRFFQFLKLFDSVGAWDPAVVDFGLAFFLTKSLRNLLLPCLIYFFNQRGLVSDDRAFGFTMKFFLDIFFCTENFLRRFICLVIFPFFKSIDLCFDFLSDCLLVKCKEFAQLCFIQLFRL